MPHALRTLSAIPISLMQARTGMDQPGQEFHLYMIFYHFEIHPFILRRYASQISDAMRYAPQWYGVQISFQRHRDVLCAVAWELPLQAAGGD